MPAATASFTLSRLRLRYDRLARLKPGLKLTDAEWRDGLDLSDKLCQQIDKETRGPSPPIWAGAGYGEGPVTLNHRAVWRHCVRDRRSDTSEDLRRQREEDRKTVREWVQECGLSDTDRDRVFDDLGVDTLETFAGDPLGGRGRTDWKTKGVVKGEGKERREPKVRAAGPSVSKSSVASGSSHTPGKSSKRRRLSDDDDSDFYTDEEESRRAGPSNPHPRKSMRSQTRDKGKQTASQLINTHHSNGSVSSLSDLEENQEMHIKGDHSFDTATTNLSSTILSSAPNTSSTSGINERRQAEERPHPVFLISASSATSAPPPRDGESSRSNSHNRYMSSSRERGNDAVLKGEDPDIKEERDEDTKPPLPPSSLSRVDSAAIRDGFERRDSEISTWDKTIADYELLTHFLRQQRAENAPVEVATALGSLVQPITKRLEKMKKKPEMYDAWQDLDKMAFVLEGKRPLSAPT